MRTRSSLIALAALLAITAGAAGARLWTAQTTANSCGNGKVEAGEQCDDGNKTSGDGCSNTCQKEAGFSCSATAQCKPGQPKVDAFGLSAKSLPYNVIQDHDGNTWFEEEGKGQIGKITPAGKVIEYPLTGISAFGNSGTQPGQIFTLISRDVFALTPDGTLWFNAGGNVEKVHSDGTLEPIDTFINRFVQTMTAGPDGNLWFTSSDGYIGRFTRDGQIKEFPTGSSLPPDYIVTGSDGNLWFSERRQSTAEPAVRIGKMTPTGTVTMFNVPVSSNFVGGLAVGSDGNVWFSDPYYGKISKITPSGAITSYSTPIGGMNLGLTRGPDGNIWFFYAVTPAPAQLGIITPSGQITSYLSLPSGPSYPYTAPDGTVWFANFNGANIGKLTLPSCTTPAQTCQPLCGDGIKTGKEQCDDGNTLSGDGCSFSCTLERGYSCGSAGSACEPACGDGIIVAPEQCDDSNAASGDGCSSSCQREHGFVCTGAPTACTKLTPGDLCGDGFIDAGEQCDDGNKTNGDGCSSSCQIELNTFTKVPLPESAAPNGILHTGRDGSIQFLDKSGVVDSVSLNGALSQIPGIDSVSDFSIGSDGNTWFEKNDHTVVKQDASGHSSTFDLSAGLDQTDYDGPMALLPMPDGTLWFSSVQGYMSHLLADGSIKKFRIPLQPPSICGDAAGSSAQGCRNNKGQYYADSLALGSDGNVWFTESQNNYIGKITPAGTMSFTNITPPGTPFFVCIRQPTPMHMTAGPDGKLWFLEAASCGSAGIGSITTGGVYTDHLITNPSDASINDIAAGPDGAIWFTETTKTGKTIGRMQTNGTVTFINDVSIAANHFNMTLGPDGNFWFLDGLPYDNVNQTMSRFRAFASTCGNGKVETGEQCDDGNTMSNDGCSSLCQKDTRIPSCGDGVQDPGEQCDDHNKQDGDGCSSTCTTETGFTCTGTAPTVCTAKCGNHVLDQGEQCDDGNRTNGDGCSSSCTAETGYLCTNAPYTQAGPPLSASTCAPVCGDGVMLGGEQCDDSNTANGDGCSSSCKLEQGFVCAGTPTQCRTSCGDGIQAGSEQCDDGNTANGDGCSSSCQLEQGYACTGKVCAPVCGDSLITGSEQCDDGNAKSGDGCSSSCQTEQNFTCTGTPSVCMPVPVSDAACGSIEAPAHIAAGSSFTAYMTMQNSGTQTWTSPGFFLFDAVGQKQWNVSGVQLPSSPVAPGQSAAFTVAATAPSAPGQYSFAWQMGQGTAHPFGKQCQTSITVDTTPLCGNPTCVKSQGATCVMTCTVPVLHGATCQTTTTQTPCPAGM